MTGRRTARRHGRRWRNICAGADRKKPVAVTLLADHASFEQVAGDRRESLKLHRDEWGYLSISIESDAPFLFAGKESADG